MAATINSASLLLNTIGSPNTIRNAVNNKSIPKTLVSHVMNHHVLETNGKKSFLISSRICSRYEKVKNTEKETFCGFLFIQQVPYKKLISIKCVVTFMKSFNSWVLCWTTCKIACTINIHYSSSFWISWLLVFIPDAWWKAFIKILWKPQLSVVFSPIRNISW